MEIVEAVSVDVFDDEVVNDQPNLGPKDDNHDVKNSDFSNIVDYSEIYNEQGIKF